MVAGQEAPEGGHDGGLEVAPLVGDELPYDAKVPEPAE
jgi:hypothetical protein